jgi:leucyl aminopeptidase
MYVELVPTLAQGADVEVVGATVQAPVPDGCDARLLEAMGFAGRTDQITTVHGVDGEPSTVVVGCGDAGPDGPSDDALRRAAAVALRQVRSHATVAVGLVDLVPADRRVAAAKAVAEGVMLGAYHYGRYKTTPVDSVERVLVVSAGGKRVADAVDRGVRVGEAQCLARDLVNEPGGSLTPQAFAEVAVEVAERENLQVTVMDLDDITAAGLGGLLGVNRGSHNPARMVVLTYEPDRPRGTLALVGKGVTFDSGGLSIKPGDGMMSMKMDMAGAAAVLGAFSAFGAVGVKARVHGFIPLTDNMLGGDATRPGDVLRIRNGTTVEVLNTDAEGRLILADALCLACEEDPDAIIDLATLTGAVDVALGPGFAGLMGNSPVWLDQVREAADRAGEQMWPLPLPADYRRWIESEVADLRNISKVRSAGTITAGLFLESFVTDDTAWAHLDIAATAWATEARGLDVAGGTGYGVRTLIELARTFTRPR